MIFSKDKLVVDARVQAEQLRGVVTNIRVRLEDGDTTGALELSGLAQGELRRLHELAVRLDEVERRKDGQVYRGK